MKTTIELPDALIKRAKKAALERGVTLKSLLIEALEKTLGPQTAHIPELRTLVWPVSGPADSLFDDEQILQMIRQDRQATGGARSMQPAKPKKPSGSRKNKSHQ